MYFSTYFQKNLERNFGTVKIDPIKREKKPRERVGENAREKENKTAKTSHENEK